MPGNLSSMLLKPPIFAICCNWSLKSSKSNFWPCCILRAKRCALVLSTLRSASSISVKTSPMPNMREAIRSAWKASRASVFSPLPMNLIGLPVMVRTLNAAPPRASPSVFANTIPVNGSASLNALAVLAASWPVIASTTKRVSIGFTLSWTSLISLIIASSTANRPAVSTINTSAKLCLALRTASRAMSTGV